MMQELDVVMTKKSMKQEGTGRARGASISIKDVLREDEDQHQTSGCPMKEAREGGGCVFSNQASAEVTADLTVLDSITRTGGSLEEEYLNYSAKQTKDLFDALRNQTDSIEDSIGQGEREVLLKDEIAFLLRQHEVAVANLTHAQNTDYQKYKLRLEAKLQARAERKKAKREARASTRASKKRDFIIQQQEKGAISAFRVRDTISERRAAYDLLTQHMYEIHDKQRKNLVHAQERKFQNEKLLVDLETRHLKEEMRSTLMKKFQVRQNHQGHLNKRINDNLREVQLMELRHSKERFELEMVSFEEVSNKGIVHANTIDSLRLRQMNELHAEKENVISKHEQEKEELLKAQQKRELKRLQQEHRIALKQLRIKHDQM
jgi:hypothetical protein